MNARLIGLLKKQPFFRFPNSYHKKHDGLYHKNYLDFKLHAYFYEEWSLNSQFLMEKYQIGLKIYSTIVWLIRAVIFLRCKYVHKIKYLHGEKNVLQVAQDLSGHFTGKLSWADTKLICA